MGKLKESKCTWRLVVIRENPSGDTVEEVWSTKCGVVLGVDEGGEPIAPYGFAVLGFHSPDFTYCPYCGSHIELVETEEGDDEKQD